MPKDEHETYSYSVERIDSELVRGWRLRQYRDGEQVKTGIFTPNGGWDTAFQLAEEAAHDEGRQWIERNDPEIPW